MYCHKKAVSLFACITLLTVSLVQRVSAADLNYERERAKDILSVVSSQIAKSFYDKDMKGLDWKALTNEARTKIDNAKSTGEIYTAIFTLVNKLDDSHTIFLQPGHVDKFLYGFSAKAYGDDIRIYSITKNSAAAEAGLQVGDHIIAVNGYDTNRANFDLMMLYYRVLRPVSQLQIEFVRGNEPAKKVIVTAKVKAGKQVVNFASASMTDLWSRIREQEATEPVYYAGSFQDGIGYLYLPTFGKDSFRDLVSKVADSKVLVIDLRGNGGGLADGLRELCGHFESEEAVLASVIERKKTREEKIKPLKPALSQKMVILVDSQSASASELFARHFQKTGKATVVGDRSSGRVNEAQVFNQQAGTDYVVFYAIEIATGKVVLPGGEELEKLGVKPDVPCLPSEQNLRSGQDTCLVRAVEVARQQLGLAPELTEANRTQIERTLEKVRQYQERLEKE